MKAQRGNVEKKCDRGRDTIPALPGMNSVLDGAEREDDRRTLFQ